jgi:propionyl-CoA carboxylase beta chain
MGAHFEHGMDLVYSWATGEFAIMGAEQAAALLYRKEIAQVKDPDSFLKGKIRECREKFADLFYYASCMNINDIIKPTETRRRIINGFNFLEGKEEQRPQRRNGNIPL